MALQSKPSFPPLVFCVLAIFDRTRQGVTWSRNEILKLKCAGRAVISQAQPIADKEKAPWKRRVTFLGCSPSAASEETSITGVLNSGGSHWLQGRGIKSHWAGEFYNLCAGGEAERVEPVSRRSLSRPTFMVNVNVGRPLKKIGPSLSWFISWLTAVYWTSLKAHVVLLTRIHLKYILRFAHKDYKQTNKQKQNTLPWFS